MHTFDGKRSVEDGGLSYHFCLTASSVEVDDILYTVSFLNKEINNKVKSLINALSVPPPLQKHQN